MRSKNIRLATLLLVILLAVPLVTKVVGVVRGSVWDGSGHINIAVDNGDIHIWSLEPQDKHLTKVIIPSNVYLLVSSYGSYRAGAVGRLSLLENKDGQLLIEAIAGSLGVSVDAVIIRKEGRVNSIELDKTFGFAGIGTIAFAAGQVSVYTNLTLYDMLRLWLLSFTLRKEAIEIVDLANSQAVSKITLPDNTEGLSVDRERFGHVAQKYFLDTRLANENLTIEIVNGTKTEGLANQLAFVLTNIGGTVIATGKSEVREEKTKIVTKVKSYTSSRIAKITGGDVLLEQPKEGRADILVVLGGE